MARRRYNIETIKQLVNGENPFYQSGYTPKAKRRKDGEEWTDIKGRSWKKVNGAVISVNKQMDSIRKLLKRICSRCGQDIDLSNDKLDHKVFPKTGKCYTCLEADETALRVCGGWKEYEESKMMSYRLGALKDFREKVIESVEFLRNDTGKMGLVMQNGDVMTWTGKSNPQWLIDAEADLIKVNEEIKKVEEEISKLEEKKQ